MSKISLFSRLAGYSQNPKKLSIENFTTEMLAYLFNSDLNFRRRFIEVIFDDQRMVRPFKQAIAYAMLLKAAKESPMAFYFEINLHFFNELFVQNLLKYPNP